MQRSSPVVVLALTLSSACAAELDPESSGASTDVTVDPLFGGCGTERLIANAPEERRAILRRAARWVDSPVDYSQTDSTDGYRQDCSGFVAMAWGKSSSMTTHSLPPRTSSTAYAREIDWSEMLPGDAVNRAPRVPGEDGHVRLYAGDDYLGYPCYWEQTYFLVDGIPGLNGTFINSYNSWRLSLEGYVPVRPSGY